MLLRLIMLGIGGLVTLIIVVAVAGVIVSNTSVESCHYDETTNLSVVIEGEGTNSRSRTVTGNACD